MVASRTRLQVGLCSARFWFSAFCVALLPTSIGYQDLDVLVARRPVMSHRGRDHLIASPFGTIEAATFSYSRPIGTTMPQPPAYQLVNFDPSSLDTNAWSIAPPLTIGPAARIAFPTVNRRLKGDRLPVANAAPTSTGPESLPQLQPIEGPPASAPVTPPAPPVAPGTPRPKNVEAPQTAPPTAQADGVKDAPAAQAPGALPNLTVINAPEPRPVAASPGDEDIADIPPEIPAAGEVDPPERQIPALASLSLLDDDAGDRDAQIYFGAGVMGAPSGLERWAPGAEPIMVARAADSGIKLVALEGTGEDGPGGETVTGKDDVSRLQSPADRLSLFGKPRARAEKCLADAVYFEARGEPLRGQQAVAQVVMNRVFSGYYPNNVCGVVYQNANRHLACQFTFACEGKDLSRIDEPDMWEQAKRIAKDTLDGKLWLAEVGHATHYHAYWVHPSWVHEMTRLYKLGVHTFYRPRAWGDGDDAPAWGKAPATSEIGGAGDKPETAAKGPQAAASPVAPTAGRAEPSAKL
jgi:hypothetical protein